jgi:uncharacterized membrane protein YedE/YeeE
MKIFVSFLVGFIFALGLGISGMTRPDIVKGFLDIWGNWNPALIGVMAGAIAIHSIAFYLVKHRKSPLFDTQFYLPTKKSIDKKLILGSILFGIGWGWAGICPGPGIVSLMSGQINILIFIVSMIAGMYFFKLIEKRIS